MAAAPAVQKIHVNVRLITIRGTTEQYVKGWHALNEVDTNACEEAHIPKEQEQDHENRGAGHSPYGGEKKVAGPIIDGTGKLVVMPIKCRNEPCRYC